MRALGHIGGFLRMAGGAFHFRHAGGMRKSLDRRMAIAAIQNRVRARLVFRRIYINALPRLRFQILLAVASQAIFIGIHRRSFRLPPRLRASQQRKKDRKRGGSEQRPATLNPTSIAHPHGTTSFFPSRYFNPKSVNIFGLASSMASIEWQVSQSFGIDRPSAVVWLPSWQRKHPGKSVCPKLFG